MQVDGYGNRRFYGIYRGVVKDNKDPLGKSRVRLQIPQILGVATTDWAWSQDTNGVRVSPPNVGQGVWVQFEGGDPSFPVWTGTFGVNGNTVNLALNDLTDVNTAGVTNGQTIVYQSSTSSWIPGTATGGGGTLNDLTDVTITSPATGQTIKYDAATSAWVNGTVSGLPAGGTAGQILTKNTSTDYDAGWSDNYADWTSQVKQYVRAGEILTKGQAVYVSSADGTNILVSKASNATEALSSKTIGLIAQDLNTTDNKFGYVITEGLLGGLDTNAATVGDPVWLGVSGALIYGLTNKPIAPAHLVYIGVVTKKSSGSGEVFIKPQNGFELQELHNVLIGSGYSSTPADNNLLAYDSASSLWKNQTGSQANLVTLSDTGTVTNTMLANSGITFGATAQALGSTISNIAGVTINSTTIPSSATLLISSDIGSTVQAYDADLGAIGALAGTSGLLKKTAANTWSLDTSTYLTDSLVGFPGTITGAIYTSTVAPTVGVKAGDHWLDPDTGNLFVYYDDGTSNQWVQTSSGLSGGTDIRGRVGSLESRTTDVETLNTTQNGRLTAVESLNTTQDSRLTAVEGVNTTQDGRLTSLEGYTQQNLNYIINSSFDIWQRGTTGTPTTAATRYVADRWETYRAAYAAGLTVSRQVATDVSLLPNIQYCMRVQRTAANAATGVISAAQALDTINAVPLAGKPVTLSFYARAGANYSSASSALSVSVQTGTGTDQPLGAATPIGVFATGAAAPISQTATLTTSWQRFSYSGTIATSATQVGTVFTYTPVGTAGAADYFEVTGVQLEVGSVATSFRRNAPSIQAELAACQRYYFRLGPYAVPTRFCMGQASSVTSGQFHVQFPVRMRTAPTAIETSGVAADFGIVSSGSGVALSGIPTFAYATVDTTTFLATSTYPSANSATTLFANANTPYLAWSAEL
jgi:hypothetical protein